MAPASSRTPLSGPATAPALVHLLARLADVDGPQAKPAFAERLGQWLHWTDAVALSAALDAGTGAPETASTPGSPADENDLLRLRAALSVAVAEALADTLTDADPDAVPDFAPLKRACLALQQTMAVRIAAVRTRLRNALGARASALAALDTVMETVLGRQEQLLLGSVPGLLQRRFERLRERAEPGWWPLFQEELHAVLRAELDLRLQPLEGLAAALRTCPETSS